jgi:hypothetical protein
VIDYHEYNFHFYFDSIHCMETVLSKSLIDLKKVAKKCLKRNEYEQVKTCAEVSESG